ncbi:MAG: DUF2231 domain-containing protein [Methyloprofundus sp.]|nr:DUF2231 domain-containing protein [Methyloprofundus sp.]MDT8425181.1 DUF2231 domain-containing protein [Methyloprofundus sp.]
MIDLIFDILPLIHGSGQEGISPAKGLEAFLTFIETLTSLSPAEIFSTLLPGISALPNIHPLIVHFPIAFFVTFFFADLLGSLFANLAWRKFATTTLYLGTISALLTVAAGMQAAYSVPHDDITHAIMLRHQGFGISVTVLALLLSLRRYFAAESFLSSHTYGHFALSAVLILLLTLGADLGGLMVYQHGVAVTPVMHQETFPAPQAIMTHDESPKHEHSHGEHGHTHTH